MSPRGDGIDALPCCEACGSVLPKMQEQQEIIETLEHELRAKRVAIRRLRDQGSARKDPLRRDAEEVAGYWREKLSPRAKSFSGKRIENTVARMRDDDYTVEDLKKSIDGYAAAPYVVDAKRQPTGRPDQRYADLELIMRSSKHVEQGWVLADRYERYDMDLARDGASATAAMRCLTCDHPRASHLPPRLAVRHVEGAPWPCCEEACDCLMFEAGRTLERLERELVA